MTPENEHLKHELCLADMTEDNWEQKRLEESIKYIGEPDIVFLSNMEEASVEQSGENSIRKAAYFLNQQFDSKRPNWLEVKVVRSELIDEHGIDIFDPQVLPFFNVNLVRQQPSSHTSYPDYYKFTSLSFFVLPQTPVVSRTPYGLFELFGDIGGLHDFFVLVFTFLLSSFSAQRISARLALWLYLDRSDDKDGDN